MQFPVFDSLPPIKGREAQAPIDWASAKAALVANEGHWVLMATNVSNSSAYQLRSGRYKDFKPEELAHFEFAVRKPDDPESSYGPRRTDLYGKYSSKPRTA